MNEVAVQNKKEPILAAIGSFIIPGAGQIYNGDSFIKGLLILLGTTIGALIFVIPGLIIWLYGIYDAYSVSKKINSGKATYKEVSGTNVILFIIIAIVWMFVWLFIVAILVAAVIAAFVFGSGTSIQNTHDVGFSFEGMSDGTVIITNEGGPGLNKLNKIEISFVDANGITRGPDTVDNLKGYGVTGSLDSIGSTCRIDKNSRLSPSQVNVIGTFDDGTVRTLGSFDL